MRRHLLRQLPPPTVPKILRNPSGPERVITDSGLDPGVRSRFGHLCTLSLRKYRSGLPKRPEPAFRDPAIRVPDIVAGQMDVLPGQRR